jgi:SAM-dependent methyltransferase
VSGSSAVEATTVERELVTTLDELDGAENYANWIGTKIAPFVGGEVIEVGAGSGTLTERIRRRSAHVLALEPSAPLGSALQHRFGGDADVDVLIGELAHLDGGAAFDTAVLVNVLEHIEHDLDMLSELRRHLRPGGRVVLFVPALSALYSEFDRRIGHHRRYRKRALTELLQTAGYQVERAEYFNALGFVLWFVGMRLLRMSPSESRFTSWFDRRLVPILQRVEARFTPPFGQSLLVVGAAPA